MDLCRLLNQTGNLHGDLNPLQLRCAAYLLRGNEEARGRERVEAFKDALLVHRPETYEKLFGEDAQALPEDDEDFEWRVPRSEADVQEMMAQLAAIGS